MFTIPDHGRRTPGVGGHDPAVGAGAVRWRSHGRLADGGRAGVGGGGVTAGELRYGGGCRWCGKAAPQVVHAGEAGASAVAIVIEDTGTRHRVKCPTSMPSCAWFMWLLFALTLCSCWPKA